MLHELADPHPIASCLSIQIRPSDDGPFRCTPYDPIRLRCLDRLARRVRCDWITLL